MVSISEEKALLDSNSHTGGLCLKSSRSFLLQRDFFWKCPRNQALKLYTSKLPICTFEPRAPKSIGLQGLVPYIHHL